MSKRLAILGSGHLGQQIAHFAIDDHHYNDVVFFDDYENQKSIAGYKIIGTSGDIIQKFQDKEFDELIIGIGYKHLQTKNAIYLRLKGSIPFGRVIHSTCWIDKTAKICPGTIIYPDCTIDSNVVVDSNCIVNLKSCIAHDSIVGPNCFLAPGVTVSGFVSIGENCFIGTGSTVIDNIVIGDNVQLGAGSVVTKDLSTPGLYVGIPAKIVR